MGATPATSYSAFKDANRTPAGTSDWTVTASLNNCQIYICTFECDVTRPLTTSDVNDVQLAVGTIRNWQAGYKIYGKSTITASGLQTVASVFTAQ